MGIRLGSSRSSSLGPRGFIVAPPESIPAVLDFYEPLSHLSKQPLDIWTCLTLTPLWGTPGRDGPSLVLFGFFWPMGFVLSVALFPSWQVLSFSSALSVGGGSVLAGFCFAA